MVGVLNVAVLAGVSAMAVDSGKSITLWQAATVTFVGMGYVLYGHPWLVAKMPSIIEFKSDHVVRNRGGITILALKDVRSFSWRSERSYTLLILRGLDGVDRMFGVPGGVSRNDLTAFLQSRAIVEVNG